MRTDSISRALGAAFDWIRLRGAPVGLTTEWDPQLAYVYVWDNVLIPELLAARSAPNRSLGEAELQALLNDLCDAKAIDRVRCRYINHRPPGVGDDLIACYRLIENEVWLLDESVLEHVAVHEFVHYWLSLAFYFPVDGIAFPGTPILPHGGAFVRSLCEMLSQHFGIDHTEFAAAALTLGISIGEFESDRFWSEWTAYRFSSPTDAEQQALSRIAGYDAVDASDLRLDVAVDILRRAGLE